MSSLSLVIGDKALSSWSMRPWLALKASGLPFKEIKIPLDWPNTKKRILKYSPSGKIPVLIHGKHRIWDSLAICEYIAELAPQLWPAESGERALARSMVSEMHSSFQSLRDQLSMDLQMKTKILHLTPQTIRDIERILLLWQQALKKSKGPFLFGEFSIADAFYAPVVFRFLSYGIDIKNKSALKYMKHIQAHPAVKSWYQAAQKEKPFTSKFK